MPTFKSGYEMKLLLSATALTSSSGHAAAITEATEAVNAKDVSLNTAHDTEEVTARRNGGVKSYHLTATEQVISTSMAWLPGEDDFDILQAAYASKAPIFSAALDGPKATSGSQGPAGNFVVATFNRNEPVGGVGTVDIELKPNDYNKWHTVAGS